MKELLNKIKKQPDKWIFRILLAAFLLSMIPIWYISRYTVPGCDDYTYGIKTHGAWLASHSLWEVVRAAAATAKEYWYLWQGTYSSIFLMTLSPGILNEKWYFLTTFLMSGMVCLSVTALVRTVCCKYVRPAESDKAGRQTAICILVLLFLMFQTLVAPSDGLFWYNGALHYVFMESVLFFQAAAALSFLKAEKRGARNGYLIVMVLLAVILGGANLLTGLQSCILMTLLVLAGGMEAAARAKGSREKLRTDNTGKRRGLRTVLLGLPVFQNRKNLWILLPYAANLAGFGLNVLAPGNTVRETTAEGMGAVKAVLLSFYWAAVFVTEWLTPIVLAGFVLLCPVIWKLVKRATARFFHPFFPVFFSFCVFAAMFTPTLFATSSEGPDRCKNVMRFVLYLLVFFNLLNSFGWLYQNRKEGLLCRMQESISAHYFSWVTVCGILMGCIFLLAADKNTYTSISALRSLANGEAARYYEENEARLALYNDENMPDVTVFYLTAKPYLLFKEDVGNEGSPDYWINISIVDYYQKNSVTVVEGN